MFDWTQRGEASSHKYRGYYDAGEALAPPTSCAQCNHPIRFCYSLHDQHMKSFVIGTCCFRNYEGTKTFVQLEAAKVLQEATRAAIVRDTRLYGALTGVRERRKQWGLARRQAVRIIREYKKSHGNWLPKELFDLWSEAKRRPNAYKRRTCALRWYETHTERLVQQTRDAACVLV